MGVTVHSLTRCSIPRLRGGDAGDLSHVSLKDGRSHHGQRGLRPHSELTSSGSPPLAGVSPQRRELGAERWLNVGFLPFFFLFWGGMS